MKTIELTVKQAGIIKDIEKYCVATRKELYLGLETEFVSKLDCGQIAAKINSVVYPGQGRVARAVSHNNDTTNSNHRIQVMPDNSAHYIFRNGSVEKVDRNTPGARPLVELIFKKDTLLSMLNRVALVFNNIKNVDVNRQDAIHGSVSLGRFWRYAGIHVHCDVSDLSVENKHLFAEFCIKSKTGLKRIRDMQHPVRLQDPESGRNYCSKVTVISQVLPPGRGVSTRVQKYNELRFTMQGSAEFRAFQGSTSTKMIIANILTVYFNRLLFDVQRLHQYSILEKELGSKKVKEIVSHIMYNSVADKLTPKLLDGVSLDYPEFVKARVDKVKNYRKKTV